MALMFVIYTRVAFYGFKVGFKGARVCGAGCFLYLSISGRIEEGGGFCDDLGDNRDETCVSLLTDY